MLVDIVLDAVGSDKAPEPEIKGAIMACRELPVRVHLVGPSSEIRDLLDEHLENEELPIVIHHASERIGMEEKAAHAVRTKRDSSMRVGLKLVREGKAKGFVTAGNTGAAMATAKMVLGALPGGAGLSTAMLGVSFSFLPAVLWPTVVRYTPPEHLGTAYGLMTTLQNAGLFGANIIAGYLNDANAAGAGNPGGYTPMLWFFGVLSVTAFALTLVLRSLDHGAAPRTAAVAGGSD